MPTVSHTLLNSTEGTTQRLLSHHFGGKNRGKKIYIQGGLHADEIPGILVALTLKARLEQLEEKGLINAEIVLLTASNPMGLAQYVMGYPIGRFDLMSGRNFNRGFPWLAQKITQAVEGKLTADAAQNVATIRAAWRELLLAQTPRQTFDDLQHKLTLMSFDADVILDLHCSREATMHVYTGEGMWKDVEPLARYLGSRAALLGTDSGGASFDESHSYPWRHLQDHYGDRFPIPNGSVAVTIEHRGLRDVSDEFADQDATAIINYLTHIGAIAGKAAPMPPLLFPATPLAGSEQFHAPVSGVLLHRADPGAEIRVGQELFEIVNTETGARTKVHSSTAGILYMRRDVRLVRQGDPIGRVSGTHVHRSGYLLSA
jgi:predicted deacylase